ncbi:MAG TPA: NFACT RNA binding domain-containing protein [Longimicrobiales bacterium]|nr:NFACT RNA binding domain-containing protein [Longimicrobiales bacterium]
MALIWDAPLTAATARELEARLGGGRLSAVLLDREPRNLLLFFREATRVFRLHPERGDVALLEPTDPPGEARGLKARLREIHAPPDERLILFQLQPPGGAAEPEGIAVELMTNQWNAVWLAVGSGRIRGLLWPRELEGRSLAAGEIYRPPEPSDRRGIDAPMDEEEWMGLLTSVSAEARRRTLLRGVAFTSSLNAAALLGAAARAGADQPEAEEAMGRGYRLWRRLRAVSLGEEDPEPRVLRTAKRLQPYPVALPGVEDDPRSTLLEAFEGALSKEGETAPQAAVVPSELAGRLERALERARRRTEGLRGELAEAPEPEPLRRTGDLILARYREVPRGEERAELEGFDGEPVTVELDPALTPQANADRYYDEAARVERVRERLPALIADAEEDARSLERLVERARRGDATPAEIRGALPEERGGRKGRKEEGPRLPYRRYRSSGGLEIRVGRGAAANEDLTFHHSRPDDVWLHARHAAGAHVILRWDGEGNPPARDLAEAAVLAALSSQARHSATVPVDWTRRKYVRSPRGSPPGSVVPERVRTVFVEPDPELERRLREE